MPFYPVSCMVNTSLFPLVFGRYNDQLTAMGDSHVRNLFYYTITYIDPSYVNQQKLHRNMEWHQHKFIWTTNTLTLLQDLRQYASTIQDHNKHHSRKSNTAKVRHLLYVDMGVWQVISRPMFDYVNSMYVLVPLLKRLQQLGVRIVWQNMPSYPAADYTEKYVMAKRSNAATGALNYIICQMLAKVRVVKLNIPEMCSAI